MFFIDKAKEGNTSFSSYLLGIALIISVYLLGSYFLILDLQWNFGIESFDGVSQKEIVRILGNNRFLAWLVVPFLFVALFLVIHTKFVHKRTVLSIFSGRETFDWKRVLFSFSLLFSVLSLFLFIQYLSSDSLIFQFDLQKFIPLFFIAIFLLPIQTSCEELLFRSYILQGIKMRTKKNSVAVLISGLMFGAIHIGNPEIAKIGYHIIVYYMLVGVFLALISLFDNGIELALGYHAANNVFAALMITNNWQAFQTDAVFMDISDPGMGLDTIIGILFILPLVFFIFYKKYKWHSLKEMWQDKL
ncbi:MAG: CPBP family intramembrane metalloprotease [Flavobacteriia bacterium]|nr:CPBP family intramembrane metalloprotease [Flavobacteriia bacterium]